MCDVDIKTQRLLATRLQRCLLLFVVAACILLPRVTAAQGLTGAIIGTVKDDQGGSGRIAYLAGERHRHHRVSVRLRYQREPVSHRRD